jgi:phosphoserine phosphatase RsbU/P
MSDGNSAVAPAMHGHAPVLLYVDGSQRRRIPLRKTPFTIGRRVEKDLVLRETRCSRDHAQIILEGDCYFVLDEGSKLGTYVNGVRVDRRQRLNAKDIIEFAIRGGAYIVFDAPEADAAAESVPNKISGWVLPTGSSEFGTLNIMLEAARRLNSSSVLDEVLHTLLDTSLRLTNAERGFVFLREGGEFRMAAGRNARGDVLADDATISRSSLMEAVNSGCEFVVTEAEDLDKLVGRMSVENYGLSSVICIPLRRISLEPEKTDPRPVRAMLYLDSRSLAGRLSAVGHDVLRTIATEAGTLVENATLMKAQQVARRAEQELEIAAQIQRRLISPKIPAVDYAEIYGRSVPCHQTGGDFYEVVRAGDSVTVVVADVSGKGISAALLASVLQGLVVSQLIRGVPLDEVAATAHAFLCEREIGEKYATMALARIHANGDLEITNCGHVPPVLVHGGTSRKIEEGCLPVGLVGDAEFTVSRERLEPGDRLFVITDGITEAQNAAGDYYGFERLHQAALNGLDALFASVNAFRGCAPQDDDCTAIEIRRK